MGIPFATAQNLYARTPGVGRFARKGNVDQVTAIPSTGYTAQVTRVTIASGPSTGTDYAISIASSVLDSAITITAQTATDAAGLEAAFIAACEAEPLLGQVCYASAVDAATAFDLTSIDPEITFTVTEVTDGDSKLSYSTTAASTSATYDFGDFVTLTEDGSGSFSTNPTVANLSSLDGPVVTYTITHGGSATYTDFIRLRNPVGDFEDVSISFAAGANADATDDNAVAEFEAEFPTGTAVANGATGTVTVTLPPGYWLASAHTITATGGGGSPAMTASDAAGDALPTGLAIVVDDNSEVPATIGGTTSAYPADRGIPCLRLTGSRADITVLDPGESITAGGSVYVDTTDGRPYATAAANRFPLPKSSAVWIGQDPVNTSAALIAVYG